jgi:acyl-CoA thioesterase I
VRGYQLSAFCNYIGYSNQVMKLFLLSLVLMLNLVVSAQQKIKVACVGNSITEGADIEKGMRYPEQLQLLLGDSYEVRNYGLGGRTLLRKGDLAYWQEVKYQEVLQWNPDVVIIKLGTNDSKPQNWIYAEDFEKDYRAFIQSFKHLGGQKKIYMCTPVPVFQDAWGITGSIVKEEIIPAIYNVAKSEGVPVIDLYTPLIGKTELFPDGVHPNAGGAAAIAAEVFKGIKDTL